MIPFIKNIDTTKPIGKLIIDYADKKYYEGFFTGFTAGIILTFGIYLTVKYTKTH